MPHGCSVHRGLIANDPAVKYNTYVSTYAPEKHSTARHSTAQHVYTEMSQLSVSLHNTSLLPIIILII